MSTKLFSLSLFSIALALVFMFAAPGFSTVVSDNYNAVFDGPNIFGTSEANNSFGALHDGDREGVSRLNFQSRGLHGDWAGEY